MSDKEPTKQSTPRVTINVDIVTAVLLFMFLLHACPPTVEIKVRGSVSDWPVEVRQRP